MNAFDLGIVQYLNSWVGISRLLDSAIIFFATYFWFVLIGCALLLPFAALLWASSGSLASAAKISIYTALSALVARLMITEFIRFLYHRPRPFGIISGNWSLIEYANLIAQKNTPSFPSGHASVVFALAMAVFLYRPKWSIPLFIGAIIIGAARIAIGVHWPSDILGGAAVGVGSAALLKFILSRLRIYQKL